MGRVSVRVAIYGRVSTVDRGQDVENQLRELRRFVARKKAEGWKLCGKYVDRASGKNGERREFRRMFVDAAERKFDLVLFWSLAKGRFLLKAIAETADKSAGSPVLSRRKVEVIESKRAAN